MLLEYHASEIYKLSDFFVLTTQLSGVLKVIPFTTWTKKPLCPSDFPNAINNCRDIAIIYNEVAGVLGTIFRLMSW
jgi:hypothetical protein